MDKYIIVNASNLQENAVTVMDKDTRQYKNIILSNEVVRQLVPSFNIFSRNYAGDSVSIEDSDGTILYVGRDEKYYGILRFTKNKLNLYWIADIDMTPEAKSKLLNSNCKYAIHLSTFDDAMLRHNWLPGGNIAIVKNMKRSLRSKEQFLDYVNGRIDSFEPKSDNKIEEPESNEVNGTKEVKEDTTVEKEEKTTEVTENKEDNKEYRESLLSRQIKNLPSDIDFRQEELERLQRLDATCNKLNALLSKLEGNEYEEAVATVVNVNDIYSFDDYPDDEIKQSDIVYETLLKMASQFDCISISAEYFAKIKIYLKKTLTSNMSYSSYKAIALIRFESNSQFGLLALIDYTEGNELVRITILRKYSNRPITDDEINKHYIRFEALRKKAMFMYT